MQDLYPDCVVKPSTSEDPKTRLEPMHAHDLKNGQWVIMDKSGIPGKTSNVKMSKTGKHGHAKFTYKLTADHSKIIEQPMHPGGDHLYKAVMKKEEYSYCDHEEKDGGIWEINCMTADFNEMELKLDPKRDEKLYEKLKAALEEMEGDDSGETMVYLMVNEGPRFIKGKDPQILQIVVDCKTVKEKIA